jgi:pyruvate kinase
MRAGFSRARSLDYTVSLALAMDAIAIDKISTGEEAMTLGTQETDTATELHDLLATLVAIRRDVLAEGDKLFGRGRDLIQREEYLESARNLACYLALRRRDLRPLQTALMRRGLSSLGRSESRVVPTLDATMTSLAAMLRVDDVEVPGYPSEASFFYGAEAITHQADAILGPGQHGRDTRIMVTLPTEAAEDPSLIQALVAHGVECVRINCAHDSQAVWEAMIANVRRAEQATGRTERVRVLMDLAGPKVRTILPNNNARPRVTIGDTLLLTRNVHEQGHDDSVLRIGCTLVEVYDQLRAGAHVSIDDGQIGTQVTELTPRGAWLRIVHAPPGGKKLRSNKGLNFPDTDLTVVPLTTEDRKDLDFVARRADMVGYSFVQSADDVALLQAELAQRLAADQSMPAMVLKIETRRAIRHLPEIIVRAAGRQPSAVMIARGDLAVELGYERIAEMQEEILWLCEAAHVPVIWATQVLEGLAKGGVPTRAEVSDAAMADRAECVMLNKGPFIVQAVKLLDDVLLRMQAHQDKKTPRLRALRSWEELFAAELVEE